MAWKHYLLVALLGFEVTVGQTIQTVRGAASELPLSGGFPTATAGFAATSNSGNSSSNPKSTLSSFLPPYLPSIISSASSPLTVLPTTAPRPPSAVSPSLASGLLLPSSSSTIVPSESIPTAVAQTFAPHRLRKKYSQAASTICQSPKFTLTLENWRDSDAAGFLRRWSFDFIGDHEYARRGLIGSLAHSFLGRDEFKCTMRASASCMVTCNEIVSLVSDPKDARVLFFILTAARHYLEIMETADNALLAAQVNLGQWSEAMVQKFYWTQETSHDRMFRMTISLINSFVSFMMFTFAPTVPFHIVSGVLEAQLKEKPDNAVPPSGAAVDQTALDLMNKKQDLEKQLATAKTGAKWAEVGYNAIGNGIPILRIPSLEFMTWEGYEKAQALNVAELGLAISSMVSEARSKNAQRVAEAFSGRVIDQTGNTMLSMILESGAFLSPNSQMVSQWSGSQVERRLTDALKFRILSEAMKSQGIYIHCSKQMNAFTCENDDNGPQNLKACIDDRVCYMNKWSGRGYWWRHHAEQPFGVDHMAEFPFMVTPEEIIISSYKTYKLLRGGINMAKFINQDDLVSPQNFLDATTPGAFFLPVCVNDRFHQHTTLDDYSFWDNFNQNSEKKTLPCSCGVWGEETEGVWSDTGLALAKHQDKYRTKFCSRQLKRKMGDNKLERFVADCRLRISRGGVFNSYQDRKHPFCDVVLDLVNRHGRDPDNMDPYLKLALECKVGLHLKKGKPAPECEMYMKAGFEELVSKNHPQAKTWFGDAV